MNILGTDVHWVSTGSDLPIAHNEGDRSMSSSTSFDETYAPRPWACDECKRVLGVVMRDNKRIRRLWVFRADIDACDMPLTDTLRHPPRGLFKIHGVDQCHGVECSVCGALNEWSMSKESYFALLSYYSKGDA